MISVFLQRVGWTNRLRSPGRSSRRSSERSVKSSGNIPKAANILKAGGAGAVAGAVATAVATSPAVKEMCDKTGKKVKATVEGAAADAVDRTRNINETLIQENSHFQ
ncbi:hypothetical protein AOXY_G30100 [Acipenser oxyrinchus oxyrinchus]|uniref:Uncharacterized protein n=1 Tax=Acipenser oxyrinchus oxyrinchus TaxID=40147 RepID=A0AAD8CPA8_ACIOX|nr:hypothetical protein AOXY_G30100 [Acipenser oxyrinchus oxyrinchus]